MVRSAAGETLERALSSHEQRANIPFARNTLAPTAMRPLEFAPLSGRRSSISRVTWWIAPSLVLHTMLVVATGVPLVSRDKDDDRPAHEVIFLAPLLPRNDPTPDTKAGDGLPGGVLEWTGVDESVTQGVHDAVGTALGTADGRGHALVQAVRDLEAPPTTDSTSRIGDDHIFQAVDVDREVERQADAAAPIYPESLRLTNVTGGVTVEFVVDTTGHIEDGSLHIIGATHPLFAASVREAIPSMRFRPAVRSGRLVRQQVIQSFQFVLQPPRDPKDTMPVPAGDSVPVPVLF
jgi:protein TonB